LKRSLAIALPHVVFAVGLGWYLAASPFSRFDFPLDDAWIHRVYAHSVAYGHGLQYNEGGPQEAGSTSPLWAIMTAPAHWLEPFGATTVVVAVKAIAVLLGFFAIHTLTRLGEEIGGTLTGGVIAAVVLAAEPRFLFSSLSGMENLLLVSVWLAGCRAYAAGRRDPSLFWFALAPLCRPEAGLLLPLWLLGPAFFVERRYGRWMLAFVPLATWSLFCLVANGHWLPTTFYLKVRRFHLGLDEAREAWAIVAQHGWAELPTFWIALAALIVWALAGNDFVRRSLGWWLIAAPMLYAAGVAGSRPLSMDGYYWTRWLDPASLVLTVAFGLALGLAFGAHKYAGAVILLCVILGLPRLAASLEERRSRLASDSRAIHLLNVQAGEWIRDHTPADARVGVNDAGAIRFFGGRWTVDLIGLNEAARAFHTGAAAEDMDWLAIFPTLPTLRPTSRSGWPSFGDFDARQTFAIPPEQYTNCVCPAQSRIVIYERRLP
jgi:hypothetical protein